MRNFIKTSVPADGYAEVKKIGERWLVHLEGVTDEEAGTVTCYECITEEEPDMEVLAQELQGWKAYMTERELTIKKQVKVHEIEVYDASDAVNQFEIRRNGQKVTDYWIARDLRTSLEGDVRAAKEVGTTYDFDVRELGITLTLDCDKFLAALEVLRRYAYTAYNVTSRHMAAVNALETVEEVGEYDYTIGYPQKLVFNLEELV